MTALRKTQAALFIVIQVIWLLVDSLPATLSLGNDNRQTNDLGASAIYGISLVIPALYVLLQRFWLKIRQSYWHGLGSLSWILLLPILLSFIAYEIVTGEYQYYDYLDSFTLVIFGAKIIISFVCLAFSYTLTFRICGFIKTGGATASNDLVQPEVKMTTLRKTQMTLFAIVQIAYLLCNLLLAIPSFWQYESLGDAQTISLYTFSIIMPLFYVLFLRLKLRICQSYHEGLNSLSWILLLPILVSFTVCKIITREYQNLGYFTLVTFGAEIIVSFLCLVVPYTLTYWICRLIKAGRAKVSLTESNC